MEDAGTASDYEYRGNLQEYKANIQTEHQQGLLRSHYAPVAALVAQCWRYGLRFQIRFWKWL
jgi:hypothetical protein